jgi:uncharacterized OB-fold protein
MEYKKPLPTVNADTEAFWKGCREHQLRFQKCINCGHVRWPPSLLCPMCFSRDAEWVVSTGRGRVYSFVVYHRGYHAAFEGDLPYAVAIVALNEGPHLLTNIVGCIPEQVRCDMPVEVTWEQVTDEITLPKFRPAPEGVS